MTKNKLEAPPKKVIKTGGKEKKLSNRVITVSLKTIPKNECRQIEGKWYQIGEVNIKDSGDCYLLDGKYVRSNSGLITWDYENNKYVRIKKMKEPVNGIVGYDKGKKSIVKGYFERNRNKNVLFSYTEPHRATAYLCLDEKTAKSIPNVIEDASGLFVVNTGNYYIPERITDVQPKQYLSFNTELYNFKDNPAIPNSTKAMNEYKLRNNKSLNKFERFLYYSLGIEYETCNGFLPERYCFQTGVIPVKDGSISGNEYVTLPYTDNKRLSRIKYLCDKLSKYTLVNRYCSLHVHFGNVKYDKRTIISLYMLFYHLQHEFNELVPPFKKNAKFLGNKGKDHCQYLYSLGLFDNIIYDDNDEQRINEQIELEFTKIFTFLNEGNPPNKEYNYDTRKHIYHDKQKWFWKSRYFFVNFCNLIFSNSKTFEARLHHGTVNAYKTINWIFINNAVIKFAEDNPVEIIKHKAKINLCDIMHRVYNDGTEEGVFLAEYLCEYINNRKQMFNRMAITGDRYGTEFDNDTTYKFLNKNRKSIFNY